MNTGILLDFGSTFTKAAVVDLDARELIFAEKEPSTVGIDAKIALDRLYEKIQKVIGVDEFRKARKLASSSAAGGLKMVVVGLTPTLSSVAGRNAAFGAGAKILKSYWGYLTPKDVEEIQMLEPEILLVCGGYEGGNTRAVLHNVRLLSDMGGRIPVIYAGNSHIREKVQLEFCRGGTECFVADNIIPGIGQIDSGQTEGLIRRLFLERITNMKGLDKVKREIERIVMPTPAAVLAAGQLLSRGCEEEPGLGELMLVDIGGATTDIHTYCESKPYEGAKIIGSPEPFAKRTVEGDLGMRESSGQVISEIGKAAAARELGVAEEVLMASVERRVKGIGFLPSSQPWAGEWEAELDEQLARFACRLAVRRHSGTLERVQSRVCPLVQRGKNLSPVGTIIGTGGQIIHSSCPEKILKEAIATDGDEKMGYMLPAQGAFFVDRDYVFYAAGILAEIDKPAALAVMKKSLKQTGCTI